MTEPLSIDELVRIGTDDGADYCDGDCPGYHRATFNNGVLTLDYEADKNEDYPSEVGSARAQFVEVGALLDALSGAGNGHPSETAASQRYWRQWLSEKLGVELHPYGGV